jgi:cullin 4
MKDELVAFQNFYSTKKHQGRKLEWNHALGIAVLTAWYPNADDAKDRTKELSVSLYQAAVLLLFSDAELNKELSYKEIQQSIRIRNSTSFLTYGPITYNAI